MSEQKITKEELVCSGAANQIQTGQIRTGEVTSQVCLTCKKLKLEVDLLLKENARLLRIIQSITQLLKELNDV